MADSLLDEVVNRGDVDAAVLGILRCRILFTAPTLSAVTTGIKPCD